MGDFGPAEFISGICHTDVRNPFPVWENGMISPCFNQLILGALPHAAMAIFNVYYFCIPRHRLPQRSTSCSWMLRAAMALLVTLFFISDVVVTALLNQGDMYLDILADGCAILAWLVHFGTMIFLRRSILKGTRGPLTLQLLVLLTVPNLILTLMAYYHSEAYLSKEPLKMTRLILGSGRTFPLTVYILIFMFPGIGDRRATMYINTVDGTDSIPKSYLDTGEMVAEDGSGCVSGLLYLWLNPLLQRGQRGELDRASDIYHLPQRLRTAVIQQHFYHCWEASQQDTATRCRRQDQGPSPVDRNLLNGTRISPYRDGELELDSEVILMRVLHKAFGPRYYILGLLKLLGNMLGFAGPLLLSNLVSFMDDKGAPVSRGAWCALGLFASTLLSAVLQNIFTFQVSKVALSTRAALVSAIYGKALRVSSSGLARFTLGEVVNFISTDTDHVVGFFNCFHELWSLPFQFSIALYLLYLQMGMAFLGGLGMAVLLIPLNKILASRILDNNKQMLRYKDSRVKLMAEVLFGIRIIKLYNWETHFTQKITDCRKQELSHLKAIKYLDAVYVYTWAALPVVMSILTIVTYVLLGHQLTAAKVFTTLALVGMLIVPLNNFPWVINSILEAKVSLERIQRFLKLSNQDLCAYYSLECPEDPQISVLLSQSSFSWQDSVGTDHNTEHHNIEMETCVTKGSLLLRNLNLNITKGSLVAVVGKVGCGKSSLLAAITGELNRLGGIVYVEEREAGFGLASQEPWIQHATVQDNILFGRNYDPTFYQTVLEACALTDDLNILPKGDKTEVGENGVTLSGGQKARLALARAVYMEKDIYLLDDPLAAVDNDVAHHLMQKCIMGILRNKTRILCTHRIEFVDKADLVVLMDNGTIIKTGTPAEVLPMVGAVPTKHRNDSNTKDSTEQVEDLGVSSELLAEDESDPSGEEQKQVGGLAWNVYHTYWVAVGRVLSLSILMSLLLMQASKNVSDWWLSNWISELKNNGSSWINGSSTVAYNSPHLMLFSPGGLLVSPLPTMKSSRVAKMSSEIFYLMVYSSIAIANTVFTAVRAFLFAYGGICATTVIHNRLLDKVLKATMTFFDTNPLGRVLNRFSSDLYTIDDSLPFVLNILLANIFGLLGMLVVMTYSLPWILVALLPLSLLYHRTQNFYRQTSRELKRLYSLTLSPIYSHFSETLSGLGTIRASRSSARFEQENLRRLEQNQRCLFLSNAAMQWLDIRVQMIGVAVVTGISIIAVIQHNAIDPGLVGLSLSYALSMTGLLSGLVFSSTQTEMQLVSVERTEEYCSSLPTEPQHQNPQVPPSWPEKGRLEFCGVVLAYREALPNALDGLSMVVHPGEKVGIVGRTGSGKSTLFLALFRMVELNQGQILLDHLDISTVGLAQLRSKLAIIPQDPFLFSGSVRENLDPRGLYTEQSLLEALDQCHLRHMVDRMGGLDAEVGEKGKTFSLGQRQLLCLARALLTQANVLCIDEATASVDHKTDELLQQTIRQRFQNKTVLTIAHRINTIMDSDRVLVMHAGKVVEFDTPSALRQIDNSVFHRLVDGRE